MKRTWAFEALAHKRLQILHPGAPDAYMASIHRDEFVDLSASVASTHSESNIQRSQERADADLYVQAVIGVVQANGGDPAVPMIINIPI